MTSRDDQPREKKNRDVRDDEIFFCDDDDRRQSDLVCNNFEKKILGL